MRIIMEGDPAKRKKEQVVKCDNCGCEFAFTQDEVKVSFYGPFKDTSIHCPYCGKFKRLSKEKRYVSPSALKEEKHE